MVAGPERTSMKRESVRALGEFDDDPHWETPMARGLSRHTDGDYIGALEFYEEAKRRIECDTKLDVSKPPWSTHLRQIDEMKSLATMKKPVVAV